jgi:biopolymer transport protein ExbB
MKSNFYLCMLWACISTSVIATSGRGQEAASAVETVAAPDDADATGKGSDRDDAKPAEDLSSDQGQTPIPETQTGAGITDSDETRAEAASPQALSDGATSANLKSIGGMIVSGGTLNIVFFGILGLFSLWSATVVLERMVNLRRERILPQKLETQLAQLASSAPAGLEQLRSACEGEPAPARRILRAGVIRVGRPMSEVEKAMEDAIARETSLLRGKYRPLNVVGNISPLVGLLGTVVGMIMAFQISSQEGLGKAEQLAEGIYLALMTTAAGLTIAIPCLLFASWFQARGERYMGDVADALTETLPCFARLESRSEPNAARMNASGDDKATVFPENTVATQDAAQNALSVRERFLRDGVFEPIKS